MANRNKGGWPTTLLGWVGYIIGCVFSIFTGFLAALLASCFKK